ncbi:MAG: hypothetical protein KIT73_12780 [Burkholderiales bacterium]|nr:hypothetical protein [Burkholderiales bacterium]
MKPSRLAVAAALLFSTLPAFAIGDLTDVTVVDRSTGQTLPLYFTDGRWYVAGRPGAHYEIRLRNQSGGDVLAVTSVDGVNVVSGETANPAQTGYVLSPGTQFAIRGWRKDMTKVAAFTFTALENSYAARTGRPDNVGVIGVAVFRRKVEPLPAPILEDRRYAPSSEAPRESERSSARADAAPAAPASGASESRRAESQPQKSLGTGHGRIETSPVRYTSFERESDQPNEVIAIWYDSHANLVARGVIPPPMPNPKPQPFPARFVPDPPAR